MEVFNDSNCLLNEVPLCNCFCSLSVSLHTMMWMLRALWLVVAHDLLEYRYMNDVTGNLFSLFLFNMARGFENVCEIISDWGKWKLRKNFSGKYLLRRKMEKRRPKKLLATWQCLNYKKSSQQLPSCVSSLRETRCFAKCFRYYSSLSKKRRWKTFRRNCKQVR